MRWSLIYWTLVWVMAAGCSRRATVDTAPSSQGIRDKKQFYSPGNLEFPTVDETVLDTFESWRHLICYFDIEHPLTEEELKDKTELILNGVRKIQRQRFPPKLNTPAIRSRLLRLETEAAQLKWVLDRNYIQPRPDSLFVRMLYAYLYLAEQINAHAGEDENFAEIFEAKKLRDELLQKKQEQALKRDTFNGVVNDGLQNPRPLLPHPIRRDN